MTTELLGSPAEGATAGADDAGIRRVQSLATVAILTATDFAMERLTEAQRAEVRQRISEGAKVVLVVSNDGVVVHTELALARTNPDGAFDNALLRIDGPTVAAFAPPEKVSTVDRGKLN